ncbi:MAG: diaminopropionate ammonia-lyase [Thermoanaerobacterales bacterium]|nr:diaminopropionate ammonia-lyase [Thermoanaerobacterales bacterium]
MDDVIAFMSNTTAGVEKDKTFIELLSRNEIQKVRDFQKSFPEYCITPLCRLQGLADHLNIDRIWIKNESCRFGLNSFKVLGSTYAIGKYLSKSIGKDIGDCPFDLLSSDSVKKKIGRKLFVTATDGNHGRAVAWAAKRFGHDSVVFLPRNSARIRLENIIREGAEASILDMNYDDAVRYGKLYADQRGGVVVQDTAWEGYTDIPMWIMQGYATLIDEAMEQLDALNERLPTHVFLQAGVGSFAGAIQGYLYNLSVKKRPITVIIEPQTAACLFKSEESGEGEPYAVKGDLVTIMAGLACGEPNIVSLNILRNFADAFIACKDSVAARGMRILGNPLNGDPIIIAGASGAVGLGVASLILERREFEEVKDRLGLNQNSRILVINTEGDTEPELYRKIVWDGLFPLI